MKIINKLYFKILSIKKQLIVKREVQSVIRQGSLQAFTMLELLLVFAIFAALAGIVMFSLKPVDVLQNANNVKVLQTTKEIESAIQAYSITHKGNLSALFTGITEEGYYDICKQGVTDASCVNLTLLVTEGKLQNIPVDAQNADTYSSGYKLFYKPDIKKYDILSTEEYTSILANGSQLTNGLIGWWKMDESSWNGTAGEVIDASGGGKNATATNGALAAGGRFGNGGTFDGVNDYVNVGNLGPFPAKGTLAFWMKPTAVENYRNPISTKHLGSNVGIRFEEYTTASPYGGFNVLFGNDSGTYNSHSYLTSTILQVNNWYHVVIVWDSTINNVIGYLDNQQKFNEANTNWPTTIPSFSIGNGFDATRYWKGSIDDVRIYDRALSTDEVTSLYNWGPGPAVHWKFDETGGVIAQDSASLIGGQPIVATGGTITEVGGYRIHTFTSSGTFNVSSAPANSTVEVLVVAGGGGGGGRPYHGGGGGGGGVINNTNYSITATSYPVTIGNGGVGYSTTSETAHNGQNSVFGSLTAIGGGGGGGGFSADGPGYGGGSGGGASVRNAVGGTGTTGQGNAGGSGKLSPETPNYGAGGGGGAGGVGLAGTGTTGGQGGPGLPFSISGSVVYYAGGGGGSVYNNSTSGAGGIGGGGAGAYGPGGANGVANTGGGGGGRDNRGGENKGSGNGGSGVVIVRYPIGYSGTIINGTNLALNKPATLSTTLGGFIASNCNNGNLTDFCHSTAASGDWWKVDLQANYNVNKVVVYNRSDCCQSRAANFKIEISTTGNFTGEQTLLYQAGVSEYPGYPSTYNVTTTNGRYVRFFVPAGADKVLNIAEIQVFGESGSNFVAGKYGNAVSLNGISEYVSVADAASLRGMGAFTLEAWVYKGTKDIKVFGKWAVGAYQYILRETSGVLQFYTYTSSQVGGNFTGGASTGWHHYAVTYDGSKMRLYKDGVENATTYNQTGNISSGAGSNLIIGAEYDLSYPADQMVDDVRIYNYARTQSQILKDMNNL